MLFSISFEIVKVKPKAASSICGDNIVAFKTYTFELDNCKGFETGVFLEMIYGGTTK